MPKKAWIGIAAVLGVDLAPALWFANQPTKPAQNAATIRIGAINPLTGPFAAYGEPVRDGMLLAVDEVNTKGGINGRKIELLLDDDGGEPKVSVNAFTKLATVS